MSTCSQDLGVYINIISSTTHYKTRRTTKTVKMTHAPIDAIDLLHLERILVVCVRVCALHRFLDQTELLRVPCEHLESGSECGVISVDGVLARGTAGALEDVRRELDVTQSLP